MRVVEFPVWYVGRIDALGVFHKENGPNTGPFYGGPGGAQLTIKLVNATREEIGLGKSDLVVARVALPAEVE